ncbi:MULTISPECIES: SsrA-binding protein SmpB [Streptomyces]|uniref:SsrA-binding protein n=1 Tax=Streptomyces venezuelae (strain ATCC 10712 / CBS 650.69 / DSM 40230 / JCM 4526 / NBRC 13096 / PD 04745) TaxID=953739 RepID=F2R4Y9_STRVP|nr:SsrA-binding protein SmpB [Streptomyces venezuelae]QER99301.1 SsrA-binding protein SmpB [Streptomyces venezuelae ATCC 10712]QES06373.1 SsrA-binding protein SmpB [Streptomyces venezuelae]QES14891.1 SsrA-binding protein SmpB [Streptomyces venezuelae]CCA56010.1 tmRNA-binding protein SmpB [Streptomyces venezuelae ATCC 10712]
MAKGLVNVQGKPAKKNQDKAPERKMIAQNKKARHDYHIIDTYECGVVLMGTEVKSLRMGRASLVDGFVQIDNHEAWLHSIHVPEYMQGSWTNHSAKRKRKLLLHREEIDKLEAKSQETGHTIVPLALYFLNGRVKVEIALAKGKKEFDKRQTLREKQDTRETNRAIAAAKRRQRAAQAG